MDLRKMFVAGLAITTLASCNDSDKLDLGLGGNGTKIVTLSAENGSLTKAIANDVQEGRQVTFEDGYVYFTNASGQVARRYTIINTAIPVPGGSGNMAIDTLNYLVNVDSLKAGSVSFIVPDISSEVHVFGNTKSSETSALFPIAMPANGKLSDVLDKVDVYNQADTQGTVDNVILYGSDVIIVNSGLVGPTYSAHVKVTPISSRLELAKLVGGGNLAAYELDGLFINHFYSKANPNGVAAPADFVQFTQLDHFVLNGTSTSPYFNAIYNGRLFDFRADGIADQTGLTVTPKAGADVWAYNLYQSQGINGFNDAPHLIIKLKNIRLIGEDPNDPLDRLYSNPFYYITVSKFREKGTPANNPDYYLSGFKGGLVYHIESISFTQDNLKEFPEQGEDIEVGVVIEVIDWKQQLVEVDLD